MGFFSSVGNFFSSDLGQSLAGTAIKTATAIIQGNGSSTAPTASPGALPLTGSGSINVGGTTLSAGNNQMPAWLWPVLGAAAFVLVIFAFVSKKK